MKSLWLTLFLAACAIPPFLTGGAKSGVTQTQTSSSTQTEEINGQPIGEEEHHQPKRKEKPKVSTAAGAFGATCKTNKDCDSNTCFVGYGELGYCTQMCNSWSECPSHWDCERARNAPQKICMQDN